MMKHLAAALAALLLTGTMVLVPNEGVMGAPVSSHIVFLA